MVNAVLGRLSQGDRHVQGPDREVPLYAVTHSPIQHSLVQYSPVQPSTAQYSPADDAAGVQIKDHSQIEPALTGPDGLCCTNRVKDVPPLSPYAPSLQVL